MKKLQAIHDRTQWARALEQIANEVGRETPLSKILGTVAWGRYDGEPTATDSKDNALFGLGFLQGVRYAALNATRTFNLDGERALSEIHERIKRFP